MKAWKPISTGIEMKKGIYLTAVALLLAFTLLLYVLSSILAFFSLVAAVMVTYLSLMLGLKRKMKVLRKTPGILPLAMLFSPFLFTFYIPPQDSRS